MRPKSCRRNLHVVQFDRVAAPWCQRRFILHPIIGHALIIRVECIIVGDVDAVIPVFPRCAIALVRHGPTEGDSFTQHDDLGSLSGGNHQIRGPNGHRRRVCIVSLPAEAIAALVQGIAHAVHDFRPDDHRVDTRFQPVAEHDDKIRVRWI